MYSQKEYIVVTMLKCYYFLFQMWIYGLGETLKRATLTSHAATSRLSGELCQVLTDMTRPQASARASLMHLLDVSDRKKSSIGLAVVCFIQF